MATREAKHLKARRKAAASIGREVATIIRSADFEFVHLETLTVAGIAYSDRVIIENVAVPECLHRLGVFGCFRRALERSTLRQIVFDNVVNDELCRSLVRHGYVELHEDGFRHLVLVRAH